LQLSCNKKLLTNVENLKQYMLMKLKKNKPHFGNYFDVFTFELEIALIHIAEMLSK